jgi:hypothetical protein
VVLSRENGISNKIQANGDLIQRLDMMSSMEEIMVRGIHQLIEGKTEMLKCIRATTNLGLTQITETSGDITRVTMVREDSHSSRRTWAIFTGQ